ncbi:MAG: TlpA family protein disulfide reductase [Anaerolineae bacterium]|nr:TlpA family protein disulfide reductase [Anaerolineae bacterium]
MADPKDKEQQSLGEVVDRLEEPPAKKNGFPAWAWAAIVIALILVGVLALALVEANRPHPEVGSLAPDFTLETLDGATITLSALRGKVVLINFWASWCVPCKEEAPQLEALWRRYKDRDVVFVGIDWADPENLAREYLEEFDITFPNGRDLGEKIGDLYKLSGVPETYLIDRSGVIDQFYLGPVWFDDLSARLERLAGS